MTDELLTTDVEEPLVTSSELPITDDDAEHNDAQTAAATALRERLALHGFELTDEVQLAEVPGQVLEALLGLMPPQPGPRPTDTQRREELAERIARSHRLPRGVRERLSGMVETIRFDDTGREEPALRVSDAVALLEETLPAHVLLSTDDVEAANHPHGNSFFTGDPRSLSDDDARRIAAQQLARTGYLPPSPRGRGPG